MCQLIVKTKEMRNNNYILNLNKNMKSILILISVLFFAKDSLYATHMMGADMNYYCLGDGKYKIVAKVYRDCRGVAFNFPDGKAFGGNNGNMSCGQENLTFTRTSIKDISSSCSTSMNPCGSPNTANQQGGVEEHTYEIIIDITKSPYSTWLANGCCEINFAIGQCCRNGALNTIVPNNFWTTCQINICNLNKCKNTCNSSAQFSNVPVAYACCNQKFEYNNGAIDTVDYDSFSYKLVDGINSLPNGPVTYVSPYSAEYPMKPFCIPTSSITCVPNPNSNPPKGFFMDKTSGDIVFTPVKCDQVGIVVIEVKEHRKDSSGNWVEIGKTRRDMQIIVRDDCNYNNSPTISNDKYKDPCEGDLICFKIYAKDVTFTPNQTIPDTTDITWNRGIPGAKLTILNPKDREKTAEFCWQTKIGDAREVAYAFTVSVTDNHCDIPAKATRGYRIKVKPRAFSTRKYDILKCGRFAFTANQALGFKGNADYKWSVRDSNKLEIKYTTKKTDTMQMPHGGRFYIVHTVNNSYGCPTSYIDTVDFPWPPKVVLATKDTYACYGTTTVLVPKISNAKAPFHYYWTRPIDHIAGDTNNVLSIPNIISDSTIIVKINDADGCVFYDTAVIFVKPLPVVNLGKDQRICTYQTETFDAANADTVKYLWNTGETTRLITKNIAGNYIVTITDTTWLCSQKDTVELIVNDTVVSIAGLDKAICNRDELLLDAKHKPANVAANYQWFNLTNSINLGTNAQTKIKPTNNNGDGNPANYYFYELYTMVTQGGVSCEAKDTVKITVNTLPKVVMPNLPARCYDYGDIELQNINGIIPANTLRNSTNFSITGNRLSTSVVNKLDSKTVLESAPVDRFIFRTTNVDNSELTTPKDYREKIFLKFTDTNGCTQIDSSKVQIINGNPIIEFFPAKICQDLGKIELEKIIVKPKPNPAILNWSFKALNKTGQQVNLDNVLIPAGSGNKDSFVFGKPDEDFYQGDYTIEYCVQNKLTTCRDCENMLITIKGEPIVTNKTPNRICVSDNPVDMLQFFEVDGKPATLETGNELYIAKYVSGNLNNPPLSLTNISFFDPKGKPGIWRFMYKNGASGCVKFDSVDMEVNDLPRFEITPVKRICSDEATFDLNNEIIIPSQLAIGGKVDWSAPSAFVNGNKFTPARNGMYVISGPHVVTGVYTDDKGCKNTATLSVTIRNAPSIIIKNTKPLQICEGVIQQINSGYNWTQNIAWSKLQNADGILSSTSDSNINYTHGVLDASNKFAWLKVTTLPIANEVCAMLTDSIQLIVHPFPAIEFSKPLKACVPIIADFTAIEKRGIDPAKLTWNWEFGNGDFSNLQNPVGIKYLNQGKYEVKLSVKNTDGNCETKLDTPDFVEAYPLPVAQFTTDPFHTTIALPRFKMNNESTLETNPFSNGNMKYVWNFGTGNPLDTSTQRNPIFYYGKDTAHYEISLKVISDKGCINTATKTVYVGPDIIVYIPDVFTPDGAGPPRNNFYNFYVNNQKSTLFQIYNRWGEKLFETKDYAKGWNGMANGAECQVGVYVYHVEVVSLEDKVYKFDGTVTLLR